MELIKMLHIATLGLFLWLSLDAGNVLAQGSKGGSAAAAAAGDATDAGAAGAGDTAGGAAPAKGAAAAAGGAAPAKGATAAASAAAAAPAAGGAADGPAAAAGGGGAGGEFDITKFGASPNSDITAALTKAWTAACASPTPSKIVIPKGTFKLVQAKFQGPCKALSIDMQIDAVITAPQDPAQMKIGEPWMAFNNIEGLTVSGTGTLDGQGPTAWGKNECKTNANCKQMSMNLAFNFLKNAMVKGITTKDSKNFHVNVISCDNITFSQFKVVAPDESPNTDGIHIGRSNGVNILDTTIGTGDDCISIGDGCKQVTIKGVTCGPGHGISVGSLGRYNNEEPVAGLIVNNCTLKGTDNGVRIKTFPNSVGSITASDMHFEDIIMDNVKNPVLIDQQYCPWNQCDKTKSSTIQISKVSFKNIKGTSATPLAVTMACSKSLPCQGVEVADIDLTFNGGPSRSICDNVTPTITGKQNPPICSEKGSAEEAAKAAAANAAGAAPLKPAGAAAKAA